MESRTLLSFLHMQISQQIETIFKILQHVNNGPRLVRIIKNLVTRPGFKFFCVQQFMYLLVSLVIVWVFFSLIFFLYLFLDIHSRLGKAIK